MQPVITKFKKKNEYNSQPYINLNTRYNLLLIHVSILMRQIHIFPQNSYYHSLSEIHLKIKKRKICMVVRGVT